MHKYTVRIMNSVFDVRALSYREAAERGLRIWLKENPYHPLSVTVEDEFDVRTYPIIFYNGE